MVEEGRGVTPGEAGSEWEVDPGWVEEVPSLTGDPRVFDASGAGDFQSVLEGGQPATAPGGTQGPIEGAPAGRGSGRIEGTHTGSLCSAPVRIEMGFKGGIKGFPDQNGGPRPPSIMTLNKALRGC